MTVIIEEKESIEYGNFNVFEHKVFYKAKIENCQALSKEITI